MSRLTPNERLLLAAALQQGSASRPAWETWRQSCPLNDDIDSGFHRLIPLLQHNLAGQGVRDPELSRYAAIRRFYWYRNQVFLREAERLLNHFEGAGIRTLVLKGLGLALTVYPRPELRPMSDLDVLVSPADALRAIELLKSVGLVLSIQLMAADLQRLHEPFRSHHAHAFRRPGEPLSLDLHVRLHNPVPSLALPQRMLAEALPLQIGAARTSIPRPTEQVFHVIVHGAPGGYPTPSRLRWAADVAMLRSAHDADINWRGLAELGRRYECLTLLQDALDEVAAVMDKPLPIAAVSGFRAPRPAAWDRMEWTARRLNLFNTGFPFGHLLDYRRFRQADREQGAQPRTFARFLADRWQLQRESEIPHAFLTKIMQRLSRRFPTPHRHGNPLRRTPHELG